MRILPNGLQNHLDSGATTMCHCWRIQRQDGVVSGYTDHDRAIAFDGASFEPHSGLTAAQAQAHLGMAVGGTEISGAIAATSLDELELQNGLYDNARVEIWFVNWADPSQRILLDAAQIGEVRRTEHMFTAELRGLAHLLDQERGRLYQRDCSAELGDTRCKVDLDSPSFETLSAIQEILTNTRFRIGLAGYPADWFAYGKLTFTTGVNEGAWRSVESIVQRSDHAVVSVWTAPAARPSPGDQVRLTAGCDKSFATCRDKFANQNNFRGFPHIPGNDALISHPGSASGPMDGGSLYR